MKYTFGTIKIISIMIFMLALGSCKSGKIAVRDPRPEVPLEDKQLISLFEGEIYRFSTFKGRRTELEILMNGSTLKTRATIAIHRDSLIVVSIVPALGYEIARMICTVDSVLIISRTDKTYALNSFGEISRHYRVPVDFGGLQSILLNEVFLYGKDKANRRFEKNISTNKTSYLFLIEAFSGDHKASSQGYEFDPGILRARAMYLRDHTITAGMNIKYEGFEDIEGVVFPRSLDIDMNDAVSRIALRLKYGSIEFDQPVNANFKFPAGYSRIKMY
jgi:hypothetical protein